MIQDENRFYPAVSPIRAGLTGCCPRCGEGRLFDGFLSVAPRCERCLDLSFADTADGPAVFVMLVAGFVVAGGALAVEILYRPALWVHVLIWLPLGLAVPLLLLRPFKGVLLTLQYHYNAEEGRQSGDGG